MAPRHPSSPTPEGQPNVRVVPIRPPDSTQITKKLPKSFDNSPTSPTSVSVMNPSVEQIQRTLKLVAKPAPMNSLLASATKLTQKKAADAGFRKFAAQQVEWQSDAWAMYDLVGELRFVVDNLASRSSKAHFYVGEQSEKNVDLPQVTENQELADLLSTIGGGQSGLSRIIERLVANLKIPGEGWLVGLPKDMIPQDEDDAEDHRVTSSAGQAVEMTPPKKRINRDPTINRRTGADRNEGTDTPHTQDGRSSGAANDDPSGLENYQWQMLSISEVSFDVKGQVVLELGPTESEKLLANPDDLFLVRVHKPHPERGWQADSATRASLSVLRELVGLTMHISAQVDSRLAGAGVFIVPESYSRAVKRSMGLADDDPDDPVTDALMQAMLTPISDRSAASALVPLVITAPDESAQHFRHITFDKGLDTNALSLREESIRRFALGMDCPPELLLGTNAMNHWGGWLMREDVVRAHVEPTLALICDALTSQFLRPVIEENFPELDAEKYVVWYDVEHLIMRASSGQDAKDLYDRDELGGDTLRRANGFDETDAPTEEDSDQLAIDAVFEMIKVNPGLMRRPGVDVLVRQVQALLDGEPLGSNEMVAQAVEAEVEATEIEEEAGVEIGTEEQQEDPNAEAEAAAAMDPDNLTSTPSAAPASTAGVGSTPATSGRPPSFAAFNAHDLGPELADLKGSLSSRYKKPTNADDGPTIEMEGV